MTDREIIEWVATAKVGDALPSGVSHETILTTCVRHGAPLERDRLLVDLAPVATAWARDWLAQHPDVIDDA